MTSNTPWPRIGLYCLIAFSLSALARLVWHTSQPTPVSAGAIGMYFHLVAGVGPALGAAAVWWLFRRRPTLGLGGSRPRLALAMVAVPALVMGARGVANPFGVEPHLFGLHLGVWIVLYALLEELGWRGYLQGEIPARRPLWRYAAVGAVWYAWHLSWVSSSSLVSELAGLAVLVAAAIGIGVVADRTRSVLAAAAIHTLGNMMGLTTDFRVLLSAHERLQIAGVCLLAWAVMLVLWLRRGGRPAAA